MVSSAAERDEEGVQMEVRSPQPQSFGHRLQGKLQAGNAAPKHRQEMGIHAKEFPFISFPY